MKIQIVFLVAVCILIASCASDAEKVDKLIRQNKYAEAREYVHDNCYKKENYNKLLSLIIEAELEDCYEDNDTRSLQEVKKEYKRDVERIDYLCQKKFADNFKDILKRGDVDFILSVFNDWEIKAQNLEMEHIDQINESKDGSESKYGQELTDFRYCDYDDIAYGGKDNYKYSDWNGNTKYNYEANFLNNLIDHTLEVLIEQKDVQNIQKCISYYKPYVAVKSKKVLSSKQVDVGFFSKDIETRYPVKYELELVNTAKEEALKKISAAGIEL